MCYHSICPALLRYLVTGFVPWTSVSNHFRTFKTRFLSFQCFLYRRRILFLVEGSEPIIRARMDGLSAGVILKTDSRKAEFISELSIDRHKLYWTLRDKTGVGRCNFEGGEIERFPFQTPEEIPQLYYNRTVQMAPVLLVSDFRRSCALLDIYILSLHPAQLYRTFSNSINEDILGIFCDCIFHTAPPPCNDFLDAETIRDLPQQLHQVSLDCQK